MNVKKNSLEFAELPNQRIDNSEEFFSIGDLAREFNVTLRTLRFYEDRGLLAPKRDKMTRLYSAQDRARLAVILKGKQLGFTLTEIQEMVSEDKNLSEPASNLNITLEQINEQISFLEKQRDEIEAALLELKKQRDLIMA